MDAEFILQRSRSLRRADQGFRLRAGILSYFIIVLSYAIGRRLLDFRPNKIHAMTSSPQSVLPPGALAVCFLPHLE
jgi:hypothetical protein